MQICSLTLPPLGILTLTLTEYRLEATSGYARWSHERVNALYSDMNAAIGVDEDAFDRILKEVNEFILGEAVSVWLPAKKYISCGGRGCRISTVA